MATQMCPDPSFALRSGAGIHVIICEPDPSLRARLRWVVASNPLFTVASEPGDWSECKADLDDLAPELLIIRSELLPDDWASREDKNNFLPVVVSLGGYAPGILAMHSDPHSPLPDAETVKRLLNQAISDVYDRKLKQLCYLVERYVTGSQPRSQYKSVIEVEHDGKRIELPANSIVSIIAARKFVEIRATTGHFMVREPIHLIASRLDPVQFVRIHRSVIINSRHLDPAIDLKNNLSQAVLLDGSTYPVGRSYRDAFAATLNSKSHPHS